jgi:hypothetical protein
MYRVENKNSLGRTVNGQASFKDLGLLPAICLTLSAHAGETQPAR